MSAGTLEETTAMMTANLHPQRREEGKEPYELRADVVDTSPSFAVLEVKSESDRVTFFFRSLEEVAAFGRAIEREAEVCMAERDAQAQEVA